MAGLFSGETSDQESSGEGGGRWYFSKKEIDENSPSRRDSIDLKKENYLRKSYCTFLQDLGMRLKVPQVTIATAIIFCHRFFLRQSHAKNDRRIIATVCMFLAGKVEETPRPLKDVILMSYEIIHKKDPAAVRRIKQKEVYEQQKELILLGERVLLATLGFDLNVHHPYKPLVEAIKKFQVAQNTLAQVAWNFVNDGLRTSLCLQFMPHHIAAGAIFLAAKFLRVKLPSDGEKVWWQEFDVTPRQLEEVSNQMLELYEQNRTPQSQASEAEGSMVVSSQRPSKGPDNDEHGANTSRGASSSQGLSKPNPNQKHAETRNGPSRISHVRVGNGNSEINSTTDNKGDEDDDNDGHHYERETLPRQRNSGEIQMKSRYGIEMHNEDDRQMNTVGNETRDNFDVEDKNQVRGLANKDATIGQSPQDVNKKLDMEKIKARIERRKALGDISRNQDPVDELERELEDVEVPGSSGKIKPERKHNWSKSANRMENENSRVKHENDSGDVTYLPMKGQYSNGDDLDTVEEGELEPFDDAEKIYKSPKLSSKRKRKPGEFSEERNGIVRHGYSDREYKRQQLQENHV